MTLKLLEHQAKTRIRIDSAIRLVDMVHEDYEEAVATRDHDHARSIREEVWRLQEHLERLGWA